ncbi:GntR family transcriptional regulator [Actibacterium mucosum KCTC 23349]|uniref:GntR family transcriptional regulator n=1 Tax=Actibacterium mucosum KCTC 23349 TaxID=1454373 RepID=A0A037ZII6_9RHOB|nr:GntR family transcriptional regulator [Actibacterium mucosum]KAJ56265.1 GntR family transcriptional regulator [Actibacterium mucosum KCTC 23349]
MTAGTEPLAERIAAQLRRDILLGKLAPGAPVKERDNATEMGVSRTPMREAIRILAQDGLLTLRPTRSPIVADPSLAEVLDQMQVLSVLEALSGRLACTNASDREIDSIVALNADMPRKFETLDRVDFFEFDMNFHRAIARASHNPSLIETHDAYLSRLWRARFLSASHLLARTSVLGQHDAIVDRLRARDAEGIEATIRTHMELLESNISDAYRARDAATQ